MTKKKTVVPPVVEHLELPTIIELLGLTLTHVMHIRTKYDDHALVFTLDDGRQYKLYHEQECCENVVLEDICGHLDDLVGSPLTMAEVIIEERSRINNDHETFTFYKLATIKGYVTLRWEGSSNGYYSESVEWGPVKEGEQKKNEWKIIEESHPIIKEE